MALLPRPRSLTKCCPQLNDAVLGALDLLLRWVVLRVCEGNTQCLLRILELASRLLDSLYDQVGRLLVVVTGQWWKNAATL